MSIQNKLGKLIPSKYRWMLLESSPRSKEALKNIVVSMVTKCISILTSFLIVPITINYVNPTQYGVWLTISSITAWITYFNLGLGNGFRNKFTEAKAKNDIEMAQKYVSTTYFAITVLVIFLFLCALIVNACVNWASILHLDMSLGSELSKVFVIIAFFFCFNMIVSVFNYLLLADQKPGLSSIIQVVGQILSLIVIYILTKVSSGSLTNLALYYSGIPCLVMLFASFYAFKKEPYKVYKPSLKNVDIKLIKNILNIGIQFFFINICLILIFQIINIIITRELGPDAVTEYNIAYKYFHLIYMLMVIVITPFWSAFTDAYSQGDFEWMINTLHRLEISWLWSIVLGVLMLFISPWFYRIWIGKEISIHFLLSLSLLIYMLTQTLGAIYMQLINGIGTIRLQLYIYIFCALLSWPLVTYSCRWLGVYGAAITPSIVYLLQAIFGKIQLNKLLNKTAFGLWAK